MPDTQRDITALQALFADNTTQQISPQDLRDFLVSVLDIRYSPGPPTGSVLVDNINVQACRDLCAADSAKMTLWPGTYVLSEPIESWQGGVIEGAGRDITILQAHSSFAGTSVVHIQLGTTGEGGNCEISRLSVDANGEVADGFGLEGYQFHVHDFEVYGATTNGIHLYTSDDTWSMYNWFIDYFICRDNGVRGIYVEGDNGVTSFGCSDGTIAHGGVFTNGSYGIYTTEGSAAVFFLDIHTYEYTPDGNQTNGFYLDGIGHRLELCNVETFASGACIIFGPDSEECKVTATHIRSGLTGVHLEAGATNNAVNGGCDFDGNTTDWDDDSGLFTNVCQGNTPETVNRYFKIDFYGPEKWAANVGTPTRAFVGSAGTYFRRDCWAFGAHGDPQDGIQAILHFQNKREADGVAIYATFAPDAAPGANNDFVMQLAAVSEFNGQQIDHDPFGSYPPAEFDGSVLLDLPATMEEIKQFELDSVLILPGEIVKMNLGRLSAHASDTFPTSVLFLGMQVIYLSYRP